MVWSTMRLAIESGRGSHAAHGDAELGFRPNAPSQLASPARMPPFWMPPLSIKKSEIYVKMKGSQRHLVDSLLAVKFKFPPR